ncbi:MAG: hypothetical protein ACK55I_47305, partial [bacterium]
MVGRTCRIGVSCGETHHRVAARTCVAKERGGGDHGIAVKRKLGVVRVTVAIGVRREARDGAKIRIHRGPVGNPVLIR